MTLSEGDSIVLNRQAVVTIQLTGTDWWSPNEERMHAIFLASAIINIPDAWCHYLRSIIDSEDLEVSSATTFWTSLTQSSNPVEATKHIQKAWDTPAASTVCQMADYTNTPTHTAGLRAAVATDAEDWLHASPVTAVGQKLSDKVVRIAAGFPLGSRTCQAHSCVWGSMVDAQGLRGLSFKRSTSRQIRPAQMNVIIWRSAKKAQYPAVKEPSGLWWSHGKRLDGATLTPWTRGEPEAWDVTIPDIFANSFIRDTSTSNGGGWQSGCKQSGKIHGNGQDSPLTAHRNRDGWWLKRIDFRTHDGETVPFPVAFHFFTDRECSRIQKHIRYRALIFVPRRLISSDNKLI